MIKTCNKIFQCDHYWHRRYNDHYGQIVERKSINQSWKSIYLERHVRKLIEEFEPQYQDEYRIEEILKLSAPFVSKLYITQLKNWKPPKTSPLEQRPRKSEYPVYHINFEKILKYLPEVQYIDMSFGIKNIGLDYEPQQFDIDPNDLRLLADGINKLVDFRCLRILRSNIQCNHIQKFVRNIKANSINEIDFSYCKIGDLGAIYLGKLLQNLLTMRILILKDNLIGPEGANG